MAHQKPTLIARICERSERVDRGYLTPCRIWTGNLDHYGYGRFSKRRVHVVIYEHVFGSVIPGNVVHHRCDQRDCHEPLHLVEMTRAAHVRIHAPTRCKNGHEFTPENTYWIPGRPGQRKCRACHRRRQREYRA